MGIWDHDIFSHFDDAFLAFDGVWVNKISFSFFQNCYDGMKQI